MTTSELQIQRTTKATQSINPVESKILVEEVLKIQQLIGAIGDAAIVVHGSVESRIAQVYLDLVYDRWVKWAITNIQSNESHQSHFVKLNDAIQQIVDKHAPRLLFVIIDSPYVIDNRDVIKSQLEGLEQVFAIQIVPIFTDEIQSEVLNAGYLVVAQSLTANLTNVKSRHKANYVNLISLSEKIAELAELKRLLNELGLPVNLFLKNSYAENLKKVSGARWTISINPDETEEVGRYIEQKFSSHFLRPQIPIGIAKTSEWLADIAIASKHEDEAGLIIAQEVYNFHTNVDLSKLSGSSIFINHSPSIAFAFYHAARELGLKVVGLKVPYLNEYHAEQLNQILQIDTDVQITIGGERTVQEVQLLDNLRPDYYLSSFGNFTFARKQGVTTIDTADFDFMGYKGVYNFIDILIHSKTK